VQEDGQYIARELAVCVEEFASNISNWWLMYVPEIIICYLIFNIIIIYNFALYEKVSYCPFEIATKFVSVNAPLLLY